MMLRRNGLFFFLLKYNQLFWEMGCNSQNMNVIISHFKGDNSTAFRTYIMLRSHHLYLVPGHSYYPQRNPAPGGVWIIWLSYLHLLCNFISLWKEIKESEFKWQHKDFICSHFFWNLFDSQKQKQNKKTPKNKQKKQMRFKLERRLVLTKWSQDWEF